MTQAEKEPRGIDAGSLGEHELIRELETIHRSRHDTLLHGSPAALSAHTTRMAQLEEEYLRRHPERSVSPGRTRAGARDRSEAGPDAG
ncbi:MULTISPECIES: DUF6158 family protein [Streptomyces]|uniref:DUF6158 family protein n=1 Tax=Streptomyces achmelvichensis TaxID=3134111 RepID=A0ACC6PPL6_9ACTN|nr:MULTISPECIES: DUF6158 family protein [unclassified Streptomyces]WNO76188.1 DUF6158 family protein [Streptomyces sp. AM8-1-1]WST36338.1 DUF6158 family protein [Streptomyces sp. NBC_01167]